MFFNFSKSYYFSFSALEQLSKLLQLILVNLKGEDCIITLKLQIENTMTVQHLYQFPLLNLFHQTVAVTV